MAGSPRRVLVLSLAIGFLIVLLSTFTASEHTLTLVLVTLLATGLGLIRLLQISTHDSNKTSRLHPNLPQVSNQQHIIEMHQDLPDPLELDLDIPL